MSDLVVSASEFKAVCLALLDRVAETHESIEITKHGRPVARLVALNDASPIIGSVSLISDNEEDYFSTAEIWEVDV